MSNADLIEPPHEIICYALKVGDWFKERNITHWKLADCASRDALELADKRIAELAKFHAELHVEHGKAKIRIGELERKLAVAREALKQIPHALGHDFYAAATTIADEALAQIGGEDASS